MERVGAAAVAVEEVQHLVEEQQHRRACAPGRPVRWPPCPAAWSSPRGRAPRRPCRLRAGGRCRSTASRGPAAGPRHCRRTRRPSPWARLRVPASRSRSATPLVAGHRAPVLRQVVERRERVGLAAAELGDERQHRRGVVGLAREPSQHHPRVLAQRPREASAREELRRIAVVLRRRAGDDLLQRDGELVGVERAAFADFLARGGDLVPGLHRDPPTVSACERTDRPPVASGAQGWHRPGLEARALRRTSGIARRR